MNDTGPVLFVVLCCFALGYWAVSVFMKRRNSSTSARSEASNGPAGTKTFKSAESYYRSVLAVSDSATEEELRAAYRNQLAKYHPDKVTHLGEEFYDLASRRTKEIIEAYEFLKANHPARW